ncbi:MAG: hypothetical protein U1A78_26635 [Polyangia bacterium]
MPPWEYGDSVDENGGPQGEPALESTYGPPAPEGYEGYGMPSAGIAAATDASGEPEFGFAIESAGRDTDKDAVTFDEPRQSATLPDNDMDAVSFAGPDLDRPLGRDLDKSGVSYRGPDPDRPLGVDNDKDAVAFGARGPYVTPEERPRLPIEATRSAGASGQGPELDRLQAERERLRRELDALEAARKTSARTATGSLPTGTASTPLGSLPVFTTQRGPTLDELVPVAGTPRMMQTVSTLPTLNGGQLPVYNVAASSAAPSSDGDLFPPTPAWSDTRAVLQYFLAGAMRLYLAAGYGMTQTEILGAAAPELQRLVSLDNLWALALILAFWVLASVVGGPAGLAINAILVGIGIASIAERLISISSAAKEFALRAWNARTVQELKTAGPFFARALVGLGAFTIELALSNAAFVQVKRLLLARFPTPRFNFERLTRETEGARPAEPARPGERTRTAAERAAEERAAQERAARERSKSERGRQDPRRRTQLERAADLAKGGSLLISPSTAGWIAGLGVAGALAAVFIAAAAGAGRSGGKRT